MKKVFCFVLSILVLILTSTIVYAFNDTITFGWSHDNPRDLAGFKLHYSTTSGSYIDTDIVDIPLTEGNLNVDCEPDEGEYCYKLNNFPIPDTGLTTYYFVMTAYDTEGYDSEYSNEVNKEYDFEIPPAVSDLSISYDKTTSFLSFSWTYDSNWLDRITKWTLWEADLSGGPYTKVVDIQYDPNASQPYTTNVEIVVPDGHKITKYYVLVTHRGSLNNYVFSSNSNEVSATIDKMPPNAPFVFKIKISN